MEVIKLKGIDEEIYYTESKDKLPIYIWKNEYAKSFYMSLNVKYGSIHTDFQVGNKKYHVPNGIAHFMEHIKFNVDKDTTANDLFDPLGSDINAFTTFRYTSYLVYGVNKIKENLDNLLDYVFTPYFTKDIIKKEKSIIASEINMGKDQPFNRLYNEFNKCLYHKDNYRNLITGEIEDIKDIDLKDIELIYNTFYHPENMFLIVTGNINPYEIERIVNENLEKKEIQKYLNPVIKHVKEPSSVYKKEEVLSASVEVPKAKIGLKIDKKVFKDFDIIKLNIILNIILNINFGDTSDLKEDLLSEGLITFLGASRVVARDYVIIDITLESKYLDEAIKRVIDKLNNLEVKEEEIKRKINSSIANLITNYEASESVNSIIQNYIIYYGYILDNLKEIYESITLSDVEKIMERISTKEMSIIKMINKE